MKNRYILLILFSLFALYMVWCNISFIYTRENKSNIILVDKISYPKDSFNTESATVFWQGFYHDWGYNHRVNRMGDWIQSIQKSDNGIQAVISHLVEWQLKRCIGLSDLLHLCKITKSKILFFYCFLYR